MRPSNSGSAICMARSAADKPARRGLPRLASRCRQEWPAGPGSRLRRARNLHRRAPRTPWWSRSISGRRARIARRSDGHCLRVFQARDREHERSDAARVERLGESLDGLRVARENGGAIDEKVGERARRAQAVLVAVRSPSSIRAAACRRPGEGARAGLRAASGTSKAVTADLAARCRRAAGGACCRCRRPGNRRRARRRELAARWHEAESRGSGRSSPGSTASFDAVRAAGLREVLEPVAPVIEPAEAAHEDEARLAPPSCRHRDRRKGDGAGGAARRRRSDGSARFQPMRGRQRAEVAVRERERPRYPPAAAGGRWPPRRRRGKSL